MGDDTRTGRCKRYVQTHTSVSRQILYTTADFRVLWQRALAPRIWGGRRTNKLTRIVYSTTKTLLGFLKRTLTPHSGLYSEKKSEQYTGKWFLWELMPRKNNFWFAWFKGRINIFQFFFDISRSWRFFKKCWY